MDTSEQVIPHTWADPPVSVHRWNYWAVSLESAFFIMASNMMGPMTLFPFLFKQTGIPSAYLGLFTIATLIASIGGPIGSALAGGVRYKLPFCIRIGFLQRIAFFAFPIGVMLLYKRPVILLFALVVAWTLSSIAGGASAPVYQVVITNGTHESWWGRLMGMRNLLGSLAGLGATFLVWQVNRWSAFPYNYIVMGWVGMTLLFVSLFIVSRIREVPVPSEYVTGARGFLQEIREMRAILREDPRIRWVILARNFRTFGFFTGTYCIALFIDRCHLTDAQMWIPIILYSVADSASHWISGRFVDQFGVRATLALSSLMVALNALLLTQSYSFWAFILVIPSLSFGGALVTNGWPTLLVKLAPPGKRSAYFSTISLATTPVPILISLLGLILVLWTGYTVTLLVGSAGALVAGYLFWHKVPDIRQAPRS